MPVNHYHISIYSVFLRRVYASSFITLFPFSIHNILIHFHSSSSVIDFKNLAYETCSSWFPSQTLLNHLTMNSFLYSSVVFCVRLNLFYDFLLVSLAARVLFCSVSFVLFANFNFKFYIKSILSRYKKPSWIADLRRNKKAAPIWMFGIGPKVKRILEMR